MKTGFSLCSISYREKPVFITWELRNENRFFPVWKYYTVKTLFWPCTGPVRDCSAVVVIGLGKNLLFESVLAHCADSSFLLDTFPCIDKV